MIDTWKNRVDSGDIHWLVCEVGSQNSPSKLSWEVCIVIDTWMGRVACRYIHFVCWEVDNRSSSFPCSCQIWTLWDRWTTLHGS